MSVADCTNVPSLLSGTHTSIWTWISFFFAEKIDVLSPAVFSAMKGYRTATHMSLTPGGTYVIPTASVDSAKLPLVVFIGRLVPLKGIEHFLDILPALWITLNKNSPFGFQFKIAGYGSLEGIVQSRVEQLADSGIPISFIGYSSSETLLNQAAVVLSLQEVTNYPSRVVAEALFAGCGVIVRDTGDSRAFGEGIPGLTYCQPKLDALQLADQISTLLKRVILEPGFAGKVRTAAIDRFSSADYIAYFQKLICVDSTFAA
jgi:glycosyltransferase involved in cell wall biosynthesis